MTIPDFASLIDLASERLGGSVLMASDDFFAEKENLIKEADAVFKPGVYTDNGKWMDGWESRRKRTEGHDWCVVALGMRGSIQGLDVDTSHFRGNHPPEISLEAFDAGESGPLPEEPEWTPVCPRTAIQEDSHNYLQLGSDGPWTHVRLNIFPDGGVARLRVYGRVVPSWDDAGGEIELSAVRHGGHVVGCSDQHFCKMGNLILPDEPRNMGDGWETRRKRGPGNDWVIVSLGAIGRISRIELNTRFYKGNYPDRCSIEGSLVEDDWEMVLGEQKMLPDHLHCFDELLSRGPFRQIRLNVFPDGGVARMRVFGTLANTSAHE